LDFWEEQRQWNSRSKTEAEVEKLGRAKTEAEIECLWGGYD